MIKKFIAFLSGLLCACALAACTGTTFTTGLDGCKAEFSELNETTESLCELNFTDLAMNVELETGSVDIEIVDVEMISLEDDDYVELDTIFTAEGLVSGDSVACTDNDGDFIIRITGHDATGTVTISKG